MKIQLLEKFEKLMAAATFAEKNDHSYALMLMNGEDNSKKQKYSRKNSKKQPGNRPRMRA